MLLLVWSHLHALCQSGRVAVTVLCYQGGSFWGFQIGCELPVECCGVVTLGSSGAVALMRPSPICWGCWELPKLPSPHCRQAALSLRTSSLRQRDFLWAVAPL